MSLVGSIARGFGRTAVRGASAAGSPSYSGLMPPLGSVASASGLLVSQASAMTVSAVHAAVRTISTDVARCKGTLYETQADGSRVRDDSHAVAQLLRRPNRIQSWFEFARDLMAALLLRGNGFAAILRDRRGDPAELILINPDAVLVLEAVDGQIFYQVNRLGLFQIAVLQDFPVAIPAEDVLHLRGLSFNTLVGASTIGLARDTIGLAMGLGQQQSRWVGNGARPSVVLETDRSLNPEAAARLKKNWEDFTAGVINTGRTAVLEDGVTAKALQLTSVDLQMIEQLNLTIQDVGRFFGVPPRKLGQPDTSRGSTIIQEDQSYVNGTISPYLDMIEQKFDLCFGLADDGFELDLDEGPLLRADPLTRFNIYRIGKLSGLITTNEARRAERMPPVPGGDVVMQPVNMAALGSDFTGTAPDGNGRPPAGMPPEPGVPTTGGDTADDVAPEG